jgi:4'-phosphopantetheinyl transferase EntD
MQFLQAGEMQYVARSLPKRVAEFTAGRACARAALAELHIVDFPLHVGARREPLWPSGITGSITHAHDYCGVAVAETTRFASLGIDAERRGSVRPELWSQLTTQLERSSLERITRARAIDLATVIFSAKEAFYKCQFQVTRQWINFSEVSVSCYADSFQIRPQSDLRLNTVVPEPWVGRFTLSDDLVLTAISLPRPYISRG